MFHIVSIGTHALILFKLIDFPLFVKNHPIPPVLRAGWAVKSVIFISLSRIATLKFSLLEVFKVKKFGNVLAIL